MDMGDPCPKIIIIKGENPITGKEFMAKAIGIIIDFSKEEKYIKKTKKIAKIDPNEKPIKALHNVVNNSGNIILASKIIVLKIVFGVGIKTSILVLPRETIFELYHSSPICHNERNNTKKTIKPTFLFLFFIKN